MHAIPFQFIETTLWSWFTKTPPHGIPPSMDFEQRRTYLLKAYLHPHTNLATTDGDRFAAFLRLWAIHFWSLSQTMNMNPESPSGNSLADTHDSHDRLILEAYSEYYHDMWHAMLALEQLAFDSGIITGKTQEEVLADYSERFNNEGNQIAFRLGIKARMRPAPKSIAETTLAILVPPVEPTARLAEPFTTQESERILSHFAALESSAGITIEGQLKVEESILNCPNIFELSNDIIYRNRRPLSEHTTLSGIMRHQNTSLHNTIFLAGKQHNILKSKEVRHAPILLEDYGIPLPTPGTILPWFSRAAIAPAWHCNGRDYIAFTIPQLPMTTEHRNGGQVQAADSSASHSLTIRSNHHWRDDWGRLYHGDKRVWLASRGDDSAWVIEQELMITGMERPQHLVRALLTLDPRNPGPKIKNYLLPFSPKPTQIGLPAPWKDPWQEGNDYADWHWHTNHENYILSLPSPLPHQVDDPFRQWGKQRLYMRFRDPAAIKGWIEAFLASCGTALDSNITELLSHTYMTKAECYSHVPSAIVTRTRKGKTQTFDFSGFGTGAG